jgi:hypothetical protein
LRPAAPLPPPNQHTRAGRSPGAGGGPAPPGPPTAAHYSSEATLKTASCSAKARL